MTGKIAGFLYSQRVGTEIAEQVRLITAPCQHFATNFMGNSEAGQNSPCVRLEAVINPLSQTWRVERITRLSGKEDSITHQITELNDGLCFFDALHYCIRFESTEQSSGKQAITVPGKRWSSVSHCHDVANEAGQPIDADGDLHPAVGGAILGSGFFSDKAYETAQKTKDHKLVKVPAVGSDHFLSQLSKKIISSSAPVGQESDLVEKAIDKFKLVKAIQNVMKAGSAFKDTFKSVKNDHFQSVYQGYRMSNTLGTYFYSVVSLGTLPAALYLAGQKDVAPMRAIYKSLAHFSNAVDALPPSSEKTLCLEFIKAARYEIPLERAASTYDLSRTGKKPMDAIKSGLPFVEEAGKAANLSELDIERLKAAYLEGKLKHKEYSCPLVDKWGHFEDTRYDSEDALFHVLKKYIERVEAGPS